MGLTWIDHDTIEKPIEELSAETAESKLDIEFKVETLGCSVPPAAPTSRKESVASAGKKAGDSFL